MTIGDRQRDKGAAGMVDPDKGGIGDDVESLLATIIRMGAPTDVGEQTGRMAKPPLLDGFIQTA